MNSDIGTWTYAHAAAYCKELLESDAIYSTDWKGDIATGEDSTHAVEQLSEILHIPLRINYQFPELMEAGPKLGIGSEEIQIALNEPLNYADRDENYGKRRPVCWYPAVFNYKLDPKYFKITFLPDEFDAVSKTEEEVSKFVAAKISTTNNELARYYNAKCRTLLGRAIIEVCKAMSDDLETFDPSKEYKAITKDITGKNVAKYIRVQTEDKTKKGVIFRNIEANQSTSWEDAVDKGLINELHLFTIHNRPGWSSENISKHENCCSFIKKVINLAEKAKTAQEGFTLSGSCISSFSLSDSNFVLYLLPGIIEELAVEVNSSILNPSAISAFNSIKIKQVEDFGKFQEFSNITDNKKIYGLLVNTTGLKIRNISSRSAQDQFGEMDFRNVVYFRTDALRGSYHTFINVFKDE